MSGRNVVREDHGIDQVLELDVCEISLDVEVGQDGIGFLAGPSCSFLRPNIIAGFDQFLKVPFDCLSID